MQNVRLPRYVRATFARRHRVAVAMRAAELRRTDLTLAETAAALNAEGLTTFTGRDWSPTYLAAVLSDLPLCGSARDALHPHLQPKRKAA